MLLWSNGRPSMLPLTGRLQQATSLVARWRELNAAPRGNALGWRLEKPASNIRHPHVFLLRTRERDEVRRRERFAGSSRHGWPIGLCCCSSPSESRLRLTPGWRRFVGSRRTPEKGAGEMIGLFHREDTIQDSRLAAYLLAVRRRTWS